MTDLKQLVIFGASTLARLAHYYATREMGLQVAGFVVDDAYLVGSEFLSLPLSGWSAFCASTDPNGVAVHVAIGYRSMRARKAAFESVHAAGYETITIRSRASYVADDVALGNNNFIMPGVVIESGAALASNNVVWSNTTICHDCVIGSHNFFAANTTLGGAVRVGEGNFLGFSSVVLQGCRIGSETLIGAQSLVRQDTRDLHQYQGTPAVAVRVIDRDRGVCVD